MDEYEKSLQVMDDDGAGSAIGGAITSVPAGQIDPVDRDRDAMERRWAEAMRSLGYTRSWHGTWERQS